MEKIAKYYLTAEIVFAAIIFFSGFYDASFWFFGIALLGIVGSSIGLAVSWLWCRKRLQTGGEITKPYSFLVGNAVLLVCSILFMLIVFSGGISFLM